MPTSQNLYLIQFTALALVINIYIRQFEILFKFSANHMQHLPAQSEPFYLNQIKEQHNSNKITLKLHSKFIKCQKQQPKKCFTHFDNIGFDQSHSLHFKEVNSLNLGTIKQDMQLKTKQTLQKCRELREKQLQNQITTLKEENYLLQCHFDALNKKYKEKREQANQLFENYNDLRERQQWLSQKYNEIQNKYKNKEQQIIVNFNKQINHNQKNYESQTKQLKNKVESLQKKIQSLQKILSKTQKQYQVVKGLLNSQINNSKNKSQDSRNELKLLKSQNNKQQQLIYSLQNQIGLKNRQILSKNQNLNSLQKLTKQMSQKIKKLEIESKKQLMKQRSITKKAIDSLNVNKKYSELQLSKSRKKQKLYLHSQKQLIGKIKQICKQQTDLETNDKSQVNQKSSLKSLNTTLKTGSDGRQNVSPLVSKFVIDEETSLNLSPIQFSSINIETCKNEKVKSKNSLNSCRSVPGMEIGMCRIQIPVGAGVQAYSRGTPCFEMQRKNKMFKANKLVGE